MINESRDKMWNLAAINFKEFKKEIENSNRINRIDLEKECHKRNEIILAPIEP
jgi:hypothetical protein